MIIRHMWRRRWESIVPGIAGSRNEILCCLEPVWSETFQTIPNGSDVSHRGHRSAPRGAFGARFFAPILCRTSLPIIPSPERPPLSPSAEVTQPTSSCSIYAEVLRKAAHPSPMGRRQWSAQRRAEQQKVAIISCCDSIQKTPPGPPGSSRRLSAGVAAQNS